MMRYLLVSDLARVHCANVLHQARQARSAAGSNRPDGVLSFLRGLLVACA